MLYLGANIRFLRKEREWTQAQLAEHLGVNRSLIGAYEEGRSEPRIKTLQTLSHLFKVPTGDLIEKPLNGETRPDFKGHSLRILPITIGEDGVERAPLIPQRAAAGYTRGYADLEYIEQLPAAHLPFPELSSGGTLRIFQIEGESMLPVQSGSYIIGEYVEDWQSIKNGRCYLLLTLNDGIVYKRVENEISQANRLILHSDNPEYESYELAVSELLEVWQAKGVLSFAVPDRETEVALQNQKLMQTLDEMKAEIRALHAKVDRR